ncbi:MAG: double zinc ribbon domain-containing protein [Thermoplasmatota archaeon]
MVKCWNCRTKIPKDSKRCPECGTGQEIAAREDEFNFTSPDQAGVEKQPSYDSMFMNQDLKGKKGESCPVCGASMSYKERVESWFCPKCKSFY